MKIPAKSLLAVLCITLAAASATFASGDKDVLRATLDNGLRVVIVKNSLAPVVTTEMNYLVGSNEAPEGFPGMAHAQEHMMFRGSPGMSAAQLSSIMALMGGDFNADTQQNVTQYFLTVPRDDIDVALRLEAVRMQGVLDTQDLWEAERGAIEQEVARDLSNPEYVFSSRLLAEMFSGTPYAHDALGTRPSFRKTSAAMLKRFYDDWYAPNNAILVIAGDVDPRKTLALVKELFESIPRRPLPPRPAVTLLPLKPSTIALDTDLPYGLSVVGYRLPGSDSPDYAAGMTLADALDSRRSELSSLVPDGKALFTGFDGAALPKAAYGYALAAFPTDADGSALAATLKKIVAGYVKNGVPAELVEASKHHEIAEAEFQRNSISGLAAAWSQALAAEGRNAPDDDIAMIRKVTVEDVNRVAREYLTNDNAITAILTPKPTGKPLSSKGFGGSESFAPAATTPVELPAWARKVEQVPALPVSAVKPDVSTLPNGIRLIVQPESVSHTITVMGRIKNNDDLEEPEGKEGVSDVLGGLFSYGTVSLDRLAFQKAQDDIGADISAGTSFSLRVLTDHFDRGVELLSDNVLHPALPEKAFAIVRQETADTVKGERQSPAFLTRKSLREALYPKNDPKLRDATPETVAALSFDDVRAYYQKVFRPDLATIVVIGDVTPKQAQLVVGKYFGGWTASGPKPATDLPAVPINKPSSAVVPDASRVQDEVTLAEVTGIGRGHPDYYKLQLGNHVLSGGFYASRLYRDLREKAGLVYSVDSFIEASKHRVLFGVAYACDPPNVSRARMLVERNLRDMQTTPISDGELRRAKTLLVRQVSLSEASMDGIAGTLLSRSVDGLPLDESIHAAEQYLTTTAEQVRDAFAKWIRPADFVQVTVGPNPQ